MDAVGRTGWYVSAEEKTVESRLTLGQTADGRTTREDEQEQER